MKRCRHPRALRWTLKPRIYTKANATPLIAITIGNDGIAAVSLPSFEWCKGCGAIRSPTDERSRWLYPQQ